MADIDKVKVLVVGDSGVGKTCLVYLISHNDPCYTPSATIGCSVEVKLHEYRAGTPQEQDFFIELWDIGGAASHANSRSIFYQQVHGIILVHDLTNRKSYQNLRKWLAEILNKEDRKSPSSPSGFDFDLEQFVGTQIPILVVGTKANSAQTLRTNKTNKISNIAEEYGAEAFEMDNFDTKYLAPGTTNSVKLSKFLDKVIERKLSSNQGHVSPIQNRRMAYSYKNSHVD